MKKYSTVISAKLLEKSKFSIKDNYLYYDNEQYVWIYTVPKNTIAKLMQIDYSTYSIGVASGGSERILKKLYIKKTDGTIIPTSIDFDSNPIRDTSSNYFYFNEDLTIGVKIIDSKVSPSSPNFLFDSFVNLFFMLEYDSLSAEIEERLNSLSSRVSLLESKINS